MILRLIGQGFLEVFNYHRVDKEATCAVWFDPWIPDNESIPVQSQPYKGHASKTSGYDPFQIYGKKKMARFVEGIVATH